MLPDELNQIISDAQRSMKETVLYCKKEFSYIRTGKANPAILENIRLDYYGARTPLNQLANVGVPEPRLLTVEPYDKSIINDIEKAIMAGGLGLNPSNDGNLIRIPIPMLSEERRQELVKKAKEVAEEARISIRNFRRDAKDKIKRTVKSNSLPEDSLYAAEEKIQEVTDTYIKAIDSALEQKEKDILTV